MEQIIINNNKIIQLLMEEEQEEDEIQNASITSKRNSIAKIYQTREKEGYFEVLINGHLNHNKQKFREFFRLNYDQFSYLLSLIKVDITLPPSNRVRKPITPYEKLVVTLW